MRIILLSCRYGGSATNTPSAEVACQTEFAACTRPITHAHRTSTMQVAWSRFDMAQCSKHVPLRYGIAKCDRSISPRQHSEIKWSRLCTSLIWVQQGREYCVKRRMKDVTTRCGRYIARAIVTTKTRQPSHNRSVRSLTDQLAAICRPSDS